ncbi:MAG: helix-turn-helix domain-containing protein [Magnetococcus sp. WYHC-3]|jgi:transcriptional regulator with XRE-family HTH domain
MAASIGFWTVMNKTEHFFEELGARIVTRRKELAMTQTDLGNRIGVTQQVIASYETASRQIPAWRVPELSSALDMPLESLMGMKIPGEKRGPKSKIEKQLDEVRQLPKTEQQFVSQFLEKMLARSA